MRTWEERLYYNYKTVFWFKKFFFLKRESIRNYFVIMLEKFCLVNKKCKILDFLGFSCFSRNIRSFLSLGLESSTLWNTRNVFIVFCCCCCCFLSLKVLSRNIWSLLEYKIVQFYEIWKFFLGGLSVSQNIRKASFKKI